MVRNNVLRIEDISVSYGPVKALRHISLEVDEGEIVTLIGANGAGKSSLLEAILGINKVDSGRILFMGNDITRKSTDKIVALGICLIPEGRGILSLMTVLENLQLGGYQLKTNITTYIEQAYNRFPVLGKRQKQIAGTLSGGEQQMLSIAAGLMPKPKLVMLDEPSLGLSPVLVNQLFDAIIELNREGYTIVLSEQNACKALQCAHRGYVFETGSLVLSGTSQELEENTKVRCAFLGGSV